MRPATAQHWPSMAAENVIYMEFACMAQWHLCPCFSLAGIAGSSVPAVEKALILVWTWSPAVSSGAPQCSDWQDLLNGGAALICFSFFYYFPFFFPHPLHLCCDHVHPEPHVLPAEGAPDLVILLSLAASPSLSHFSCPASDASASFWCRDQTWTQHVVVFLKFCTVICLSTMFSVPFLMRHKVLLLLASYSSLSWWFQRKQWLSLPPAVGTGESASVTWLRRYCSEFFPQMHYITALCWSAAAVLATCLILWNPCWFFTPLTDFCWPVRA